MQFTFLYLVRIILFYIECLEKCLEFLREFRKTLGCLLKLPLYPQKEIETVLLISGLWRKAALPKTFSLDFNHLLVSLFTSSFPFTNFINYTFHCLTNLLKIQYSLYFLVKKIKNLKLFFLSLGSNLIFLSIQQIFKVFNQLIKPASLLPNHVRGQTSQSSTMCHIHILLLSFSYSILSHLVLRIPTRKTFPFFPAKQSFKISFRS